MVGLHGAEQRDLVNAETPSVTISAASSPPSYYVIPVSNLKMEEESNTTALIPDQGSNFGSAAW